MKGHITIDRELCKECHLCIHACKKGLIIPSHEYNSRGYRPVCFKEEGGECTGCALVRDHLSGYRNRGLP